MLVWAGTPALLDGGMRMPNDFVPRFFPDSTPAELAARRQRAYFSEAGLHQPVGCYVLNTGSNLALVDSGGHASFMPQTGGALAALRASGYAPEQIDTVLLTHIHPEHALGLSYDGTTRNFPNAESVVSDTDHAFWTDSARKAGCRKGSASSRRPGAPSGPTATASDVSPRPRRPRSSPESSAIPPPAMMRSWVPRCASEKPSTS